VSSAGIISKMEKSPARAIHFMASHEQTRYQCNRQKHLKRKTLFFLLLALLSGAIIRIQNFSCFSRFSPSLPQTLHMRFHDFLLFTPLRLLGSFFSLISCSCIECLHEFMVIQPNARRETKSHCMTIKKLCKRHWRHVG
jgi:hypothetical protein